MKRPAKIIICLAIILICSAGAVSADSIDLVVLLDTSESVFPIFDDLINIVIEDSIEDHLQLGDYFHLLSFAGSPQIEASRRIDSAEDMEEVLAHLLLLQPLGNYTDLLRALQFVYQFTSDLPGGRKKIVVILTDGIHDPPPDSPFAYGKRDIEKDLAHITDQIKRKDWDVRIIRLPSPGNTSASGPSAAEADSGAAEFGKGSPEETQPAAEPENLIDSLSEGLDTGIVEYPETPGDGAANEILGTPSIETPEDLGKVGTETTIPIQVKNHDSIEKIIRLLALRLDGKNILINKPEAVIAPGGEAVLEAEIRLPEGMEIGGHTLTLIPEFEGDLRFSPNEITVDVQIGKGGFLSSEKFRLKHLIVIIAVLLAVFLIILFIRRIGLSFESLFRRSSEYAYEKISNGTPVELVVEGQNTQIGMRNVHTFTSRSRFCVGGDGSPFVIFLHPFPRCIAEISGGSDEIHLYVRKPEYFPEDMEPEVTNCLEKRITAIGSNGKQVRFFFRKYISPLERINKIMRLTSKPGPPD